MMRDGARIESMNVSYCHLKLLSSVPTCLSPAHSKFSTGYLPVLDDLPALEVWSNRRAIKTETTRRAILTLWSCIPFSNRRKQKSDREARRSHREIPTQKIA